jgi:sarcosine oxidase/sarcosine oxidase subunit beta
LLALSVHLAAKGVRLHPSARVDEIDIERAAVTSAGTRHEGDAIVIAAGAWASRLIPDLQDIAVPSEQVLLYLAPPPGLATAWSAAPVVIDFSRNSGAYFLPPRPGTRLKAADHTFSRTGDPDGGRIPSEEQCLRVIEQAARSLRDFGRYTVLERKTCFYTVTADEAFILRPAGAKAAILSACSGHGFKLAPLIAEGLAAAIAGERAWDETTAWAAGQATPPPA